MKVIPTNEGDLHLTGIKDIEDVLMGGAKRSVYEIGEIARAERTLIKTIIEEGDIGKKIAEVAEQEDCDLVIVGSQKKKGIKRLIGDNVVRKVINNSPCPVLVVRESSWKGDMNFKK